MVKLNLFVYDMIVSTVNSEDSKKIINEFTKVSGEKVNLKIFVFLYAGKKELDIKI